MQKTRFSLEKTYRLEKGKNDATKPRPIVVKFRNFENREMIRSVSNRLENRKYDFSPQYPKKVLERRTKLVHLKEKKNTKSLHFWMKTE